MLQSLSTAALAAERRWAAGPMPEPHDVAQAVFGEIRESFSDLAMHDGESADGEPQLDIPAQIGLRFDVTLYLSRDVLNLCAGHFWGEWFPASDSQVVSQYIDAAAGLLSGRFRIVERARNGQVLRAFLQRPSGSGWKTVSRHYHRLSLPFFATEERVLQNVAA
jgi:hypothetical protein